MLENLDSVAWSQLTHAYGAATDVPAQIRNLTSADEGERGNALWELYGNIFHQGARYQATPYAVPSGALDPLELSSLREIARHGAWKIGNYVSVNYCELVREYGLPDSQESLIEYLNR